MKNRRKQFRIRVFVKSILKHGLFSVVLALVWVRNYILLRQGKDILSIVYYHRITDICQDGMTVGIDVFEKQIRFLKKNYEIISASELIEMLIGNPKSGNRGGKKLVLITFDDGYEDNYVNALPILERYSCPAIFFVSTGLIGNELQFEHDCKLYPEFHFRKMAWKQLRCARQRSVEIGIHSHTHANLTRTSFEDGRKEIEASIVEYERHLGKKPIVMSYPFGGKKEITADLANYIKQKGIIMALFSAYGGKNVSPFDRYNLKRINVGCDITQMTFLFKLESGYDGPETVGDVLSYIWTGK